MATYQLYYTDPITGFSVFQKDTPKGKEYKINVKTKKIPVFSDFRFVFTDNKNIKNVKTDTGKIVTTILFEIVSPTPLMAEKQFFDEVSKYLQSIGYIDFSKAAATTSQPSAPQSSSFDVNKIKKGDLFLILIEGKIIEIDSIDNSLGLVWSKETGKLGGAHLVSQYKDFFQNRLNNELTPFKLKTGQVFISKSSGTKIEITSILAKNVEFEWAGSLSYKPIDELVDILIEAGYELQAPNSSSFDINSLNEGDILLNKTNGGLALVQFIAIETIRKEVLAIDLKENDFKSKEIIDTTIRRNDFGTFKNNYIPFDLEVGQVFDNDSGGVVKILGKNGVITFEEDGVTKSRDELHTISLLFGNAFRLRENPQKEIPQMAIEIGNIYLDKKTKGLVILEDYKTDKRGSFTEIQISYWDFIKKVEKSEYISLDDFKNNYVPFNFEKGQLFGDESSDSCEILDVVRDDLTFSVTHIFRNKKNNIQGKLAEYTLAKKLIKGGYFLVEEPTKSEPTKSEPDTNQNQDNDEIKKLQRELKDLNFVKLMISDLDFVKKVNISNIIEETKKKIKSIK